MAAESLHLFEMKRRLWTKRSSILFGHTPQTILHAACTLYNDRLVNSQKRQRGGLGDR